jgi:2',3'-cyclic-nucleotide 2'-phosphodiesterase (5'-nucleotidase family)
MTVLVGCSNQTPSEQQLMVPANITGLEVITYYIGDERPNFLEGVRVEHSYYELELTDISIEDSLVNWNEEGVYVIFYRLETPFGVVTRRSRLITVIGSNQTEVNAYPLILNTKDVTYFIGDDLPNYLEGITAFDFTDGMLTTLIVDDTQVDYDLEGRYPITYAVSNKKGLETTVTIFIDVVIKNMPLKILYMNDFHGAILPGDNSIGISGIASYIESLDEEFTLFISGGDLLQGSILSNYYYGAPIIEALNALNHEAFTLGNHEFDWGIDQVLAYKDNDHEVKANFNFLGANIIETETSLRPEHVLPYDIIMRNGIKVGIIGAMGFGLESSIATSKITGYAFTDPVDAIEKEAHILRTMYDVDIVLAVVHGADTSTNNRLIQLSGTSRVDAVFNGHTHQTYINTSNQRDGIVIPIIQAGAYGEKLAQIDIYFDEGIKSQVVTNMLTKSNTPEFYLQSERIDAIIEPYYLNIQSLIETPILSSGQSFTRGDLTQFMARLMADKVDALVGFHNYGGTRVSMDYLESITVGKVYEIFPFDNIIKTVRLKGSEIKSLIASFSASDRYIRPNTTFLDDVYYKVATNDYLFDKVDYPFIQGEDIVNTGILIRDIFIDELERQKALYDYFYISQYTYPLQFMKEAYLERSLYGAFI